MKNRDIERLARIEEFELLKQKHNLNIKVEEGQLFVKGACVLMHIYGYYIEDVIYWDLYIENGQRYSNMSRLLSEESTKNKFMFVYDLYEKKHTQNVTPLIHVNKLKSTLEVEHLFFTYLYFAQEYLEDLFNCFFSKYEKHFSKTEEGRMQTIRPYL